MRTISNEEIEAMAHTIQHSENVGTAFIMDDEAIERVKEAIEFIGVGNGIEWSTTVMKRAVQIQALKHKQDNIKLNDDIKIDYVQLIHAHGLYGVDLDSDYELIEIIELQQSTTTNRVYASCTEYDDLRALSFDFIGSKEACLKYLYGEDNAEY